MSADYRKVKDLFNRAIELEPAARREFLVAECDDSGVRRTVEEMIASESVIDDALERGAFGAFGADSSKLPAAIGEYRVVGEIGRGGMGVVYEAVRESRDTKRRVAIKVIKRGMDTDAIISRFRHEQRILASLEHPFIARFLDDGTTAEGLPYYVMEFVEGVPIGEFVRAGELGPRECLAIFRNVCAAIEYAHQNLVVHRDLKPGNILVTPDGNPKLLDFGIGKILSPDDDDGEAGTATQFGMMTPAYASPEQIRGERIGTASDIYSLGVVLYELLVGAKPFDFGSVSQIGAQLKILDAEPARPSAAASANGNSRAKTLRGDLDNIILKALAKDPVERYASAGQLADDLRRYLEGVPVLARPHTFTYRFSRFVRRNRVAVVAAALIFASLLGGVAVSLWQARRAEEQRLLAEKRFAEVRTIANNVVFKYHDEIEKLEGSTAVREMLVRDATAYLDNLAADARGDAALERELAVAYHKLGDVQGKMYTANTGNSAGARDAYEKAVNLLEGIIARNPNDLDAKKELIKSTDSLVFLMARVGGTTEEKIAILDRSAALIDELMAVESRTPAYLNDLAMLYVRYGDSVGEMTDFPGLQKKRDYHLRALRVARELDRIAPESEQTQRLLMRINQRLGTDYVWIGEYKLKNSISDGQEEFRIAESHHRRMFELAEFFRQKNPTDPASRRNLIAALLSFGKTLKNLNKIAEAMNLANRANSLAREAYDLDPGNREAGFDVGETHNLLAELHARRGETDIAAATFLQAAGFYEPLFRRDESNSEARSSTLVALRSAEEMYRIAGNREKADAVKRRVDEVSDLVKSARAKR